MSSIHWFYWSLLQGKNKKVILGFSILTAVSFAEMICQEGLTEISIWGGRVREWRSTRMPHILLYSLREWGKQAHSYCSHLLSSAGKATIWATQPRPCLVWQAVSDRRDAVWEISTNHPSPWWQGSSSPSIQYLSSFLLHLPSLVKSWNGECPRACSLGSNNPPAFVWFPGDITWSRMVRN